MLRLIFEFRKEQLSNHKAALATSNAFQSSDLSASLPFYPTLIYVNTKKETEEIAQELVSSKSLSGIRVAFYHAGMSAKDRSAVHMAFSKDEIQIVIATIAFGMGVYSVCYFHCCAVFGHILLQASTSPMCDWWCTLA